MAVKRDILVVSTLGLKVKFRQDVETELESLGWTAKGTVYDNPEYPRVGLTIVETGLSLGISFYVDDCGCGDIAWISASFTTFNLTAINSRAKYYQEEHPGFI